MIIANADTITWELNLKFKEDGIYTKPTNFKSFDFLAIKHTDLFQ